MLVVLERGDGGQRAKRPQPYPIGRMMGADPQNVIIVGSRGRPCLGTPRHGGISRRCYGSCSCHLGEMNVRGITRSHTSRRPLLVHITMMRGARGVPGFRQPGSMGDVHVFFFFFFDFGHCLSCLLGSSARTLAQGLADVWTSPIHPGPAARHDTASSNKRHRRHQDQHKIREGRFTNPALQATRQFTHGSPSEGGLG